jgi:hypothetical protein
LFGWKKRIEGDTRTFRCFSRGELLAEARRHRFGEPVFVPQFVAPMALHRAVGSLRFTRLVEGAGRVSGLTRWLGSPVILRLTRQGATR